MPLVWESYDVVLPESALGAAQPLAAVLGEGSVRRAVTELGGYDVSNAGQLEPAG